MGQCYTMNGVTMSQKQLYKKIRKEIMSGEYPHLANSVLKSENITTQKEIVDKIEYIRTEARRRTSTTHRGVSSFIEDMHRLSDDPIAPLRRLVPHFDEENYIAREVALNKEDGLDPSLTEEEIRQQLKDSQLEKEMGTLQHALLEALFTTNGDQKSQKFKDAQKAIKKHLDDRKIEGESLDDNDRTLREIVTEDNPSLTDDEIIERLTLNALQIYKNIISNPDYEEAKFFSEWDIYAEGENVRAGDSYIGIKGIADLIVVKKDGSVDIIDFKVCNRPFSQWCASKLYKTEYQLGMYRSILHTHGIKANNMHLFVQPIFMNRKNADDSKVEPMQNLLKATASRTAMSRLDWEVGEFSRNIRFLINGQEEITISDSVQINDSAMEAFHKMVDYNPLEKNYSKQDLIDKKLREYIDPKGNKMYSFYDMYTRTHVKNSDKTFFTKEGGYIDQYIKKLKKVKNAWVIDLIEAIDSYKTEGTLPQDFNFLNTKRSRGSIQIIMSSIFGEFVKPQYKLINAPALIDNGILGFRNTTTNTCHFIVLTDQSLSSTYADGKYGTILGNFLDTDEVRTLNHVPTLVANVLNAESIKAIHILNSIEEFSPGFFEDKTIGSIRVINPAYSGENNTVPVEDLIANYQLLCNCTKTNNHFNKEISTSNPWKELGFQLQFILDQYEEDTELKKIVKSYKANTTSRNGKINQLIRLRKSLEKKYPKYQMKTNLQNPNLNLNNPMDFLVHNINQLIMYYQGIPIDPSGNFDKYGFHFSSILELLGMPFYKNQAMVDKNGKAMRGIGNGLYYTSAENSPSPTLRALAEYYQVAYSHIREEFSKAHDSIQELTIPYMTKYQSKSGQLLSGIQIKIWEDLLVKDVDHKVSETLTLRNPYTDTTLSKEQADFLKGILWEINKYRFKNVFGEYKELTYKKNSAEIDALLRSDGEANKIFQGRYFELPLKRARYFQRWRKVGKIGLKSLLLKEFDTLRDDWDLSKMHSTQRSMISKTLKDNSTTMYNQYDINPEDRDYLIHEEGINDFEIDLDLLALDVAFQSIRQDYFENVLQTTAACAMVLHVNQALTGVNRMPELEALVARENTSIKNESIIEPEAEDVAKGISTLRKLNSFLVLAFRPIQLIKEITFGQFTNYSRVLGQKGSSDKLSVTSVFKANKIIWGQSIGKWAKVFTDNADMASYTLCEQLNKQYAIANEDINRTVDNATNSKFGIMANPSKWMYIANSAPDYFNRMTLFIAKMMEDGCWEAHSLDKNGKLIYDFKKDKRFSELNKYGLNSNHNSELYKQQKALYIAMAEQFEKEGRSFITYDDNGQVTYLEFDRAYTSKQRNSIKEVSDLAYGYYDHETKSLVDLGFFGLIYKQFQTFLTAKTNLWLKGRPTTKGDNTAQGRFIPMQINGENCYRRLIQGENGIEVKYVPESQLEPGEKEQLDLAYVWQGDYIEGLAYSVMATLHDLFHLDFKSIKDNKYRRANLALALHDILIGWLLFEIFKWLLSGGTKKMQDIKPLQRALLRGMQDVSPGALTSMNWEPGFWTTLINLRDGALTAFSNDDKDIMDYLMKHMGAIKDFTWNEPE